MNKHDVLEARLDMLALAIECLGASLSAAQGREVAASFSERLSLLLAERGEVSADVDAALAAQAGRLMQVLRR
jgi:hypothetical protein